MSAIDCYDWDSFANKTGHKIVIDAGHVSLGMKNKCLCYGSCSVPSETEITTLEYGLQIASLLTGLGKQCFINICFSDTTKNFETSTDRQALKSQLGIDLLPQEYKDLLDQFSIPVRLTLQTQQSNYFTGRLKQLKKEIKRIKDPEEIYRIYHAAFLKTDDLFGLVHHFLLNTAQEDSLMGGTWWLDENTPLHPADVIRCPFLPIKKLGIVNLYSKSAGILCPGTYAGLMMNIEEDADRVAVYARNDDDMIAEKILRGVVACYTFKPTLTCRTLVITLPTGFDSMECCEISRELFNNNKPSWKEFSEQLAAREALSHYHPYTQDYALC